MPKPPFLVLSVDRLVNTSGCGFLALEWPGPLRLDFPHFWVRKGYCARNIFRTFSGLGAFRHLFSGLALGFVSRELVINNLQAKSGLFFRSTAP